MAIAKTITLHITDKPVVPEAPIRDFTEPERARMEYYFPAFGWAGVDGEGRIILTDGRVVAGRYYIKSKDLAYLPPPPDPDALKNYNDKLKAGE
jgi:hypothetical protein